MDKQNVFYTHTHTHTYIYIVTYNVIIYIILFSNEKEGHFAFGDSMDGNVK